MDEQDRLREIEQKRNEGKLIGTSDIVWLIAELRAAREKVAELERGRKFELVGLPRPSDFSRDVYLAASEKSEPPK